MDTGRIVSVSSTDKAEQESRPEPLTAFTHLPDAMNISNKSTVMPTAKPDK